MTATLVAPIKRKRKPLDPLAGVTVIDELLQRVEVTKALRAGIRYTLRTQTRLQEQNKLEAWSVVIVKLIECLCKGDDDSKSRWITHEEFLAHPNRGGWLNLFARNVTLEWLGEKIRVARGDARVRFALMKGIDPEEPFTREQERLAAENASLTYDPYQFAGKKGFGPDSMMPVSDGATPMKKPWPQSIFDFRMVDGDEPRVIEAQSLSDAEGELIALIHQELAKMTFEDREFFKEYVDSKYERQTTPAERKRFQRLREKIRAVVTNTAKLPI